MIGKDNMVQSNQSGQSAPSQGEFCLLEKEVEPFGLVIFGATGDLAHRKLFPALFDLFISQSLPEHFFIIGCGRSDFKNPAYIETIKESLLARYNTKKQEIVSFLNHLSYERIDYHERESYDGLRSKISAHSQNFNTLGNTLFYFALPPSLYPIVATYIGEYGLNKKQNTESGWTRLVIEKPFGHDLDSAIELNATLHRYFQEQQLFRIDHYLAKETVQNILLFRFANAIFEPIWNRQYIDHVSINAIESLGVEHRASYYEQAGVIRDMFQNHMMQLLSLIGMEPPARFETEQVRDEKSKLFNSLRPFDPDKLGDHVTLGQYGPGAIGSERLPGYRQEAGVDPQSLTPTYACLQVFIDNWRWQGVPFYLSSGKRLNDKRTEIIIQFREVPHSMLRNIMGDHITANRLILGIAPEESIRLTFQTKSPGTALCLKSVTMDFHYQNLFPQTSADGYTKVLLECIQGDHLLFWRQDSVIKSWSYLSPILQCWQDCTNREDTLVFYPAGSKQTELLKHH